MPRKRLAREWLLAFDGERMAKALYCVPLVVPATVNLRRVAAHNGTLPETCLYIISTQFAGFIEETVYRGLLFRTMLKDGGKYAVLVSSVIFGLGRIINLLNGAELLQPGSSVFVLRIGNVVPCPIFHGIFNAMSVFSSNADMTNSCRKIKRGDNCISDVVCLKTQNVRYTMDDYSKAKEFWNGVFAEAAPESISGRVFADETFLRLTQKGLNDAHDVLDYGCGSGWGLFELYHTKKFERGLGIDTSSNGVDYASKCAALSGLSHALRFEKGDTDLLGESQFDFILSVNLLDVIPESACENVLKALHRALRKGRSLLICLNPEFTEDEFVNLLHMEKRGDYYYKNGILRAHSLTAEQWKALFSRCFTIDEFTYFALEEREQAHPRMAFLMSKR